MYGEDKFIIMFGSLHIEMAIFKMLGNWLFENGWTIALSCGDINVASAGTVESFLSASRLTRARHAHHVTAANLHLL